MKKTLFAATVLAASLMAASTVQAAPQEVTMWHYFDQKPEQEMLADMVEEYNSLQDDIHINATFVSRTELMNQYTVGALSGELSGAGQGFTITGNPWGALAGGVVGGLGGYFGNSNNASGGFM